MSGSSTPFLLSPRLTSAGAIHGFPSRDLADDAARIALAAGLASIATVRQVHGDRVVECPIPSATEADALVALSPGDAVGVRTADCVPILLFDPTTGMAAAVHAGWRGTAARVAQRAVEALARRGVQPRNLLAALGPHIRACCYEVSPELAEQFAGSFGPQAVRRDASAKVHLDLAHANRAALVAAGLDPARIEDLEECTFHSPRGWFSHRREKGNAGRHLSFVAARKARRIS